MTEITDWIPPITAPVDREFRRAVFLAILADAYIRFDQGDEAEAVKAAWRFADEAIKQEGV